MITYTVTLICSSTVLENFKFALSREHLIFRSFHSFVTVIFGVVNSETDKRRRCPVIEKERMPHVINQSGSSYCYGGHESFGCCNFRHGQHLELAMQIQTQYRPNTLKKCSVQLCQTIVEVFPDDTLKG